MQVLHQQQPALAHRDVKPHNVLIRRSQPDTVATPTASSSAASGGQRESGQLKSNGETEPLQRSHAGHSCRYHAVLMVRPLSSVLIAFALHVYVQQLLTVQRCHK